MLHFFFSLINQKKGTYYIISVYIAFSLLFSFAYYFILPTIEGTPVLKYNLNGANETFVSSFIDCFYFSLTSQTTVGYGDIVPASTLGKAVTMLQLLFGYFYLALTISFFTAKAILKSDKFESFLMRYMNNKNLH